MFRGLINCFSSLQLNLTAGEELEIEYEVDGWFYVSRQNKNIKL